MVQFVFVHGVAAPRKHSAYKRVAKRQNKLCDELCFDSQMAEYYNPYWGEFGAPGENEYKSIPIGRGGIPLSLGGATEDSLLNSLEDAEASLAGRELLSMAREDFDGFLNDLALTTIDGGNSESQTDIDLANNIANYAVSDVKSTDWLNDVNNDAEFLEALKVEIAYVNKARGQDTATLGLVDKIADKAKKLLANASTPILTKFARKLTPKIAIFLGDAFKYLNENTARAKIRERVSGDIVKAAIKAKANNESLVLCGHSMGANILLDLLWDTNWQNEMKQTLGFDLKVDLFLTVGTQLGLLEELKLFATSQDGVIQGKPTPVANWWHVYNEADVLSFTADKVINGVTEYSVNTKANVFMAHSAYFYSSIFYKRLKKRMEDAGLMR